MGLSPPTPTGPFHSNFFQLPRRLSGLDLSSCDYNTLPRLEYEALLLISLTQLLQHRLPKWGKDTDHSKRMQKLMLLPEIHSENEQNQSEQKVLTCKTRVFYLSRRKLIDELGKRQEQCSYVTTPCAGTPTCPAWLEMRMGGGNLRSVCRRGYGG